MSSGRVYGGKTAEERAAERREKLLDAGLELFGTIGYGATTIEGLCASAGLNPRYFYEQFESREELLGAVYDRHIEQVFAAVVATLKDAPSNARSRLEAGLVAFIDTTLADERAARINYFELVGVSRALEARRRQVLRLFADLIAAESEGLVGPGVLQSAGDRRLAAIALAGATDGLIIDWMSGDHSQPLRQLVSTLLDIFAPSE